MREFMEVLIQGTHLRGFDSGLVTLSSTEHKVWSADWASAAAPFGCSNRENQAEQIGSSVEEANVRICAYVKNDKPTVGVGGGLIQYRCYGST